MKIHHLFLLLICIFISGCENDSNNRDNNPCLNNKRVNVVYNGNLPLNADLIQFTGTSRFIRDEVNFIKGVYIRNNGTDFFDAFELAEPNDCSQNCDIPTELIEGKFIYNCGDQVNSYTLDGTKENGSEDDFNMRRYTARRSGNTLTISY